MYRASSIVPQTEEVKITVPKEYIGKSVEIVAYAGKKSRTKKFSAKDLLEHYSKYNFNTSKLRLSREEANER
jgi:hypothetical protein